MNDSSRRNTSQHSIKEATYGALFILVSFLVFYAFYLSGF